jgi:hypothetical protein
LVFIFLQQKAAVFRGPWKNEHEEFQSLESAVRSLWLVGAILSRVWNCVPGGGRLAGPSDGYPDLYNSGPVCAVVLRFFDGTLDCFCPARDFMTMNQR